MKRIPEGRYIIRDICFTLLSVVIAILMVQSGVLKSLFNFTQEGAIIGSFIAGFFFTSIFTIAPAAIALAELAHNHSIVTVALCGAIGSAIGDLLIFLFIRDTVTSDISYIMRKLRIKKILSLFHLGFLRLTLPLLGALVIASPLPDELGLAMMGISKTKTYYLVPVAFVMNFIGILGIIAVARAF